MAQLAAMLCTLAAAQCGVALLIAVGAAFWRTLR
jgi:hypothetical protein